MRSSRTLLWRGRLLLGSAGVCCFFSVVGTFVAFTAATSADAGRGGGPGADVTIGQLEASGGAILGFTQSIQFLGLVSLVVFAASITAEYSHGTLRNLLVREPRRGVLLMGRYVSLIQFIAGIAAVAGIVSVAAAIAIAPGHGVTTGAWTVSGAARDWLQMVAAMIGFGTIGLFLGVLFRSPVAAIAVGVGYMLPAESIIGGVWDGGKWVLPGKVFGALASGGKDGVSVGAAAAISMVIVALAISASLILFRRRDVAA